jgi:hypothetical protein
VPSQAPQRSFWRHDYTSCQLPQSIICFPAIDGSEMLRAALPLLLALSCASASTSATRTPFRFHGDNSDAFECTPRDRCLWFRFSLANHVAAPLLLASSTVDTRGKILTPPPAVIPMMNSEERAWMAVGLRQNSSTVGRGGVSYLLNRGSPHETKVIATWVFSEASIADARFSCRCVGTQSAAGCVGNATATFDKRTGIWHARFEINSAATARLSSGTKPRSNDKLVEFLEGFGEGIDSDFGNISICAKDLNITLEDFDDAFRDIEHGIDHLDAAEIKRGIEAFGRGLLELVKALRACGFLTLADDIYKIASELASGAFGIVEVIVKEIINILWHEHDLTKWFHDASKAWNSQNYKMAGYWTGKIVGLFLKD